MTCNPDVSLSLGPVVGEVTSTSAIIMLEVSIVAVIVAVIVVVIVVIAVIKNKSKRFPVHNAHLVVIVVDVLVVVLVPL